MSSSGSESSGRPTIDDDELLAAVHTCGNVGDLVSLRQYVRERMGVVFDPPYLIDRLNRLHRAGYVRVFQPHETDIPRYHLTESGVERLGQLDIEPPA